MRRARIFPTALPLFALAILPPCAASAQNAPAPAPSVYSDAGNIYVARDGARTKLTASEMDVDPMLSPDGTFIVYTRQGRGRSLRGYDGAPLCAMEPRPDELRRINIDGTGDNLLILGRKGGPEQQLCDFRGKQFSSDGRRLYFLTPAWTMSGALHSYDMRTGYERFVMPANDLVVLNFCRNKYKDGLVVLSHRGFLFSGSFDWYWLYDSSGKKELGPVGPFNTTDDVLRQAHGVWCDGKS